MAVTNRRLGRGGWALLVTALLLLAAVLVLAGGKRDNPSGGGRQPASGFAAPKPGTPEPRATRAVTRHRLHAGFETGNLSEFDQASSVNASLAVSKLAPFRGTWCAQATYGGDGANGYARGIFHLSWRAGDRVTYGAAFRLPADFYGSQQGQVDLVRWDNWPLHGTRADFGGIVIFGSDKRARLVRGRYNGEEVPLGNSFKLPQGRWFTLSVFQRLSPQQPISKVLLDGRLVAWSPDKNFYGRPIDRIRYGLVAIDAGRQLDRLRLWFDQADASRWR